MKKFILTLICVALGYGLMAQNSAKYRYDFYGGITVGGTYKSAQSETIDSITVSNDTVYFWSGGTRLLQTGEGGISITDVRDEIADSLNAYRASAENLSDFVRLRTDTSIVSFGAGAGLSGDSVLFAQNMKCFGRFYIEQDTMQIMIARQTYISAGDSLKFNVYWGNAQTNTPVDSLFASPQASGEDQETWTTFNNDKIPPDVDVWPAISGTQIAGYRPYEWSFQLGYITIKQ